MILLVGSAMVTDLMWRRIPNYLTFPAIGLALIVRIVFQGWFGIVVALAGAVVAPTLLLLLRGGKSLGMGDFKLAMAVGAIVGPVAAVAAMFLSVVAGGIVAIIYMLLPGGILNQFISTFLIGLPFLSKKGKSMPENDSPPVIHSMPYGLAIGVGSLITMAVCWWTGNETWLFSFVGIVANL
jgi:prepilin peptidase CpaA